MASQTTVREGDPPQTSYTRSSSTASCFDADKAVSSEGPQATSDTSVDGNTIAFPALAPLPIEPPVASTSAVRQSLANRWLTSGSGVMHNPVELPRIYGRWHWLEVADSRRAAILGHNDPIKITMARSRKELGSGVDGNTPNVIFVPHRAHLNPDGVPEGRGYWSYMTVFKPGSARALAWLQLGSKEEYGFGDVRFPTAEQVWDLRQRLTTEGRSTTVLDGIDITWVQDSFIPNPYTNTAPTARLSVASKTIIDPEVVDPDPPYLPHDVTNGGEHDQTGSSDLHTWRTIEVVGKKLTYTATLDVSTAILGRREPHKCEVAGLLGWRRWDNADTMDWKNKKDIEKLNAWRDQAFSRAGWPKKRDEEREAYTDEEKRWLFGFVAANGGKAPSSHKLKHIAVDFNKRFQATRTPSAMSALAARLSKMHAANEGRFKPGKKRGQGKSEAAAKKRKERESSREVKPPPKRRRKTVKQEKDEEEARAQDADDEVSDESTMIQPAVGGKQNGGMAGGAQDRDGDVAMSEAKEQGANNSGALS